MGRSSARWEKERLAINFSGLSVIFWSSVFCNSSDSVGRNCNAAVFKGEPVLGDSEDRLEKVTDERDWMNSCDSVVEIVFN